MKKLLTILNITVASLGCVILSACTSAQIQQAITLASQIASDVAPLIQTYAATGSVSMAQGAETVFNSLATFNPSASVSAQTLYNDVLAAGKAYDSANGSTWQKLANVFLTLGTLSGSQANQALIAAGVAATAASNPTIPVAGGASEWMHVWHVAQQAAHGKDVRIGFIERK